MPVLVLYVIQLDVYISTASAWWWYNILITYSYMFRVDCLGMAVWVVDEKVNLEHKVCCMLIRQSSF